MTSYNRWQYKQDNKRPFTWNQLQALEAKRYSNRIERIGLTCVIIGGIGPVAMLYRTKIEPMVAHLHHMLAITLSG
jgi:hypothetical protein